MKKRDENIKENKVKTRSKKFIFAVLGLIIALGLFYLTVVSKITTVTNPDINENFQPTNGDKTTETDNAATGSSTNSSSELISNQNSCKTNEVYFIYADWCSHCQKMKPWVQQLEQEGYYFIKINSQDSDALSQAVECLKGIIEFKYIPTFVCISNKQSHVGEFSSVEEMKQFVAVCNSMQ